MRKNTIILLVLLMAIMFGLFGCSGKAKKNIRLPIEYFDALDYDYYYTEPDYDDSRSEIYSYTSVPDYLKEYYSEVGHEVGHREMLVEIVPEEYIYYYNVHEDNGILIDGYADCICRITKISEKFNTEYSDTEYEVGDTINIRQGIYLDPIADDTFLKMMKNIGACKNNKGIVGVYKANNKLINENDYRLIVRGGTIVLTEDKSYSAMIGINNNIPYLMGVYPKTDDGLQNIPEDLLPEISHFKEFLLENDKDMLE